MKVELLRGDEEYYKMWLQNVVTKCVSQLVQNTDPHLGGFTGEGGVYFTRTMSIVTCSIRDVYQAPYSAYKRCGVKEYPSRFGIVAQGQDDQAYHYLFFPMTKPKNSHTHFKNNPFLKKYL